MIEAEDLPENERVYLKKDFLGWRVVEPIRDPETKKINWFNLLVGGKKGLAWLVAIIIIAGLFYLGVTELIGAYKEVALNPCLYCSDCHAQTSAVIEAMKNKTIEFSFS